MAKDIGKWDVVFFTGDLSNCGAKDEFDQLKRELEALWAVLSKSGNTPNLCLIPGNHDMVRPSADTAIARTLTKLWWTTPDLRKKFWSDPSCEYRKALDDYFKNYSAWVADIPVPLIQAKKGILPGDFSAIIEKGNRKLGVVGLNSTFLQITSGDFIGKLDLHVSQLNSVCDGDPTQWTRNHTANLLLTHQPPNWLAPEALEHFRQEIYPPGRFIAHLCGHQHEPLAFETSEAGALPRRLRQGPSLFGSENWQGATPQKRIHGYSAGQFIIEQSGGIERLWPRIAIAGLHGGLNIAPDHRYKLENNCLVTPFETSEFSGSSKSAVQRPDGNTSGQDSCELEESHPIQLFGSVPDGHDARKHLSVCTTLSFAANSQHRHIRMEEQAEFELELRKNRCIWLAADWGTGKEGFLISAIDRLKASDSFPEIYTIKCDEAEDTDAFEALFPQQCGMPLQSFCTCLSALTAPFLLLDGIHPDLCRSLKLIEFKRITSAILDYCPNLRLILSSRISPETGAFPSIELKPLDVPDVRTYLMHHPDATAQLREADIVEKLHEQSDGLPMHIDRMIRELKVSSLASVLEADLEGRSAIDHLSESTPKALIHAVTNLEKSHDRGTRRSLRLLKILSILPYGETLDAIKHFLPAEPFFSENALQLNELALLDVVPLQLRSPLVRLNAFVDQNAPKLLKVPRQVRDYVLSVLTPDERREIVSAGVELFFGRRWRDGKIKLRHPPAEYREYLGSGAGNEFAIIHHLIMQARQDGDQPTARKAAKLGIQYCRHLQGADRYRDLTVVGGALTQALDRHDNTAEWVELAALYGQGLRMTNKTTESITYLREALKLGEISLDNTSKASIWLDVALAEASLNNTDQAVEAANIVKSLVDAKSSSALQANSTIAELTLEEPEKTQKLRAIEQEARASCYDTIANNIAILLADKCASPEQEISHLERVLRGTERNYNFYRAIVAKATAVNNIATSAELKPLEKQALTSAYSYFHAQRFNNLFDSCHESLWRLFEADHNDVGLLQLFRHSSFVWRIRGEERKEKKFLSTLSKRELDPQKITKNKLFGLEMGYYMRRLKVVLVDLTQLKPLN